ncbi:MAG: esterase-like activity of phytase family protein [Alphaproteobacteria bacterium]
MTAKVQRSGRGEAFTWALSWCRRLAVAALLAVTSGAAVADGTIGATALALDPRDPGRTAFGQAELLAAFVLSHDDDRFGGYSGLAVSPGGDRLTLVSDQGTWLELDLGHDPDGRIIGFGRTRFGALLDAAGEPLGYADAEALAPLAAGGFAVSFERDPRIDLYPDGLAGPAGRRIGPAGFGPLASNGGLEALVALPDGGFVALVEDPEPDGGHRGLAIAPDGAVRTFVYVTEPAFEPTDLAGLPSGDLLVLERKFNVIEGANVRIVRLAAADVRAGQGVTGSRVTGREVVRLAPPLATDNFEGLAVRPAPGGGVLVYLVSDDNFKPIQRTLVLQFRLGD